MIVDAKGTPLAVHTTAANIRDDQVALATLKRIPKVTSTDGVALKPAILQGDRGYGFAALIAAVLALLIKPLLAVRGSPHGSGLGRTRYVVEQCLAWIGHFRRVRCCYERKTQHFQAFNELAVCAMLTHLLRPKKRRKRVFKIASKQRNDDRCSHVSPASSLRSSSLQEHLLQVDARLRRGI